MHSGTVGVVAVTIESVSDTTPITAEDAGAASNAPSLPRKLVRARVDRSLFGDFSGTVSFVHVLPPGGRALDEDPDYRIGDRSLLFLRRAGGPVPIAGTFDVVGVDGRYGIQPDGDFAPHIPNSPVRELRQASAGLAQALKEAAR